VVDSMDPILDVREGLDTAPSIDCMTTPSGPGEAAERLASIKETAGSADNTFEPDYLQTLRQDWPD
jgi:hypothetical protein